METARGGRVAGGRARGRGRGGGRGRGRAAQVTTSPDADIQMTNSAAVDPSVVMGDSKQSKANASRNRKLDKEAERTTSSNNVKASKGRKGSKKPNTGKGTRHACTSDVFLLQYLLIQLCVQVCRSCSNW